MTQLLAASVAIVRREEVLLIQRNRAPSAGLWTLPGGRLEPGETAEQCAIRELGEELGLEVFALRPLLVLRFGQFHLQTFATEGFAGAIVPAPAEIRGWRWVRPEQIGGLATTPRLDEVVAAAFRLFARN
jgi:ADP-ribose pyrophosphatase YjhB (NUDIX family)